MKLGFWMVAASVLAGQAGAIQLQPLRWDGRAARPALSLTDIRCARTSNGLEISLSQNDSTDRTSLMVTLPLHTGGAKIQHLDAASNAEVVYTDSWNTVYAMAKNASADDKDITSHCDATAVRAAASSEVRIQLQCRNLRPTQAGYVGLAHFDIPATRLRCSGLD